MATFPTTPASNYPLSVEQEWKTIVTALDSGKEDRKAKWAFPKYNITMTFRILSQANIKILWDFYQARQGAYEDFYLYNPLSEVHVNMYIGTGDGATEIFDIPGKTTSAQSIYCNGVLQTVTTDYAILTGGGVSSSDRVDFVVSPTSGVVITIDFTGYQRFRVRFADDMMTKEGFNKALFSTGLRFKGLITA